MPSPTDNARNTRRTGLLTYLLAGLCVVAVVVAVAVVGPPSSSGNSQGTVITAARGVVQSTVSGTGTVQPASELDLGFAQSGTVSRILISEGQHVTEGQLLAELDPTHAEVTLEQAHATLSQALANLTRVQQGGESSGGSSQPQGSEQAQTAALRAPSRRAAAHAPRRARSRSPTRSSSSATSATSSTVSAETRAANIQSAQAQVRSAELAVRSDEQALAQTRLYAPDSGTIVSLDGQVGESVSARGITQAQDSSTSGSSGASGSGGSSGSSGSQGSPFAVLSDLSSMHVVVALSESEITSVRVGQTATVTIEALQSRKLAAHVISVGTLPSSSSGVVSYQVTFELDQLADGLRPGMTASAEVVVAQAEGVNLPTSAIAGETVTVLQGARQLRRVVSTGLEGNSTTLITSGLRAGERVLLPLARSSGTAALGARLRGGGLGGALGGGGGAFVTRIGGSGGGFRGAGP